MKRLFQTEMFFQKTDFTETFQSPQTSLRNSNSNVNAEAK